jgi:hypothetical protein
MSHPLSVLQKATPADVRASPFPHLVLRDAVPDTLCAELIASYPPLAALGVDAGRNNQRWTYRAASVPGNAGVPQLWKDFVAYHVSQAFYDEVAALFADAIVRLYPERFPDRAAVQRLRAGVRKRDTLASHDVLLDAQISGNTPVTAASSVRTTHIDTGEKLFSGLFYLRRPEDDSRGGDLTLCRFKPRYRRRVDKLACFHGEYVDAAHVEVVETVPYRKNVLVLFVNYIDSVHGVTERHPTDHARIFLNLVGEVSGRLYEIPERWRMWPHVLRNKIAGLAR